MSSNERGTARKTAAATEGDEFLVAVRPIIQFTAGSHAEKEQNHAGINETKEQPKHAHDNEENQQNVHDRFCGSGWERILASWQCCPFK
jgi:hypothetical protein